MAKKKKKQTNAAVSDNAYMKSGRARKLPIYECLINSNWKASGLANIVVSRKHVNGSISFAAYLVDMYCRGVKDTWHRFNLPEVAYQDFLERLFDGMEMERMAYEKVHNIIYGAVAYAEDYGLAPTPDFAITKMMLEEDTEDIPLIEYEFGVGGKPQLVSEPGNAKLPFYLSKLDKYAGKGNYELVLLGHDVEDDDYDYDDDEYSDDEDRQYFDPQTYTAEDWEEFILEVEPEELVLLRAEALYIFEKTIAAKTLSDPRFNINDLQITYDATAGRESEEENAEASEIYHAMNFEANSEEDLLQHVTRIKKAIKKWPESRVFHNYLINAYHRLNENNKAKEMTRNLVKQFPDYLFGKMSYAELLIQEDKLDEVSDIFGGQLHLRSILPDREVFHISEVVSFHALMCVYFIQQGDLHTAYGYRKMLAEIEIPQHLNTNAELFFKVDFTAIMEVKDLINEARKDKHKREELIAALLAP